MIYLKEDGTVIVTLDRITRLSGVLSLQKHLIESISKETMLTDGDVNLIAELSWLLADLQISEDQADQLNIILHQYFESNPLSNKKNTFSPLNIKP